MPMLCKPVKVLPNNGEYIYEEKYDGGRVIAVIKYGKVYLYSRKGNILTQQFPEVAEELSSIKGHVVLDGEMVVLNEGKSDYELFMKRALTQNPFQIKLRAKQYPATYFIFDIMRLNDSDISFYRLMERKTILNRIVSNGRHIRRVEYYETPDFLLDKQGLIEGIVAKKRNSIYEWGKRNDAWIKYRFMQEAVVVAVDYEETPSGIVAIDEAGNRITINGRMAQEVKRAIADGGAKIEINYYEETDGGNLRFPSFKRLVV